MVSVFMGGLAKADPLQDALNLIFKVTDVVATGVDPGTIVVSWKDASVVESGSYVQYSVGDEAGPYTTVQTVGPCQDFPPEITPGTNTGQLIVAKSCTTSLKHDMLKDPGGTALGVADPRTIWIRVVPFIEIPNLNNTTPGKGTQILQGTPSLADPAMLGPLRPTNVLCNGGGATACRNVTSVTITWTDNSPDNDEYWIFRVRGTQNPNFGSTPYRTLPGTATSFHEDILGDFGATFSYKVTAVRIRPIDLLPDPRRATGELTITELSYGDGGIAATSTGTDGVVIIPVVIAPVPAPSDPCCLVGSFTAPSTVTLNWVDVDPNPSDAIGYVDEDGWLIELAPPSLNPSPTDFDDDDASMLSAPKLDGQGTMTWRDNKLLPERGVRCYRVRGYRYAPDPQFPAVSKYTNMVCFGALPKAPSLLTATPVSNNTVNLNWRDNATTEDHYVVQRCVGVCTNSSTWTTLINNLPANSTSYADTGTTGLTTYSYRVFAGNGTGLSAPSNIAVVTTLKSPLPKPTDLTAAGRQHAIFLTWTDNSTNETGFRIEYRAPGASQWAFLTETDPHLGTGLTTYLDRDSLAANQTRCYRVRAMKVAASSDASNEACATTDPPAAPNAKPTEVKGTPNSNTSVLLTWKDESTNEAFFRIEVASVLNRECEDGAGNRFIAANLQFRFLADVTPRLANGNMIDPDLTGLRSFNVAGLVPHSLYFFRVKAMNMDGESDWGTPAAPGAFLGTVSGTDVFSDTVSGCAQTFGPRAPIWIDPDRSGTIGATRCNMTIGADRTVKPYGDYIVGGLKVEILAQVLESNVAYSDVIYANSPGFEVPGQRTSPNHAIVEDGVTDPNLFSITGDAWKLSYQFRKGIQYKLFVTSYLDDAPYWASARPVLTDITVAADCPLPGILGNRP
jgi:hypothetical protein